MLIANTCRSNSNQVFFQVQNCSSPWRYVEHIYPNSTIPMSFMSHLYLMKHVPQSASLMDLVSVLPVSSVKPSFNSMNVNTSSLCNFLPSVLLNKLPIWCSAILFYWGLTILLNHSLYCLYRCCLQEKKLEKELAGREGKHNDRLLRNLLWIWPVSCVVLCHNLQ